jgi:hypothetical protein
MTVKILRQVTEPVAADEHTAGTQQYSFVDAVSLLKLAS